MNSYEEHFRSEIEILLNQLGNPLGLHENITDTLINSKREGIFPNQVINALRIGLSIKQGNLNMAFVASMQSGKSGTIYFLCNHVLPSIGFLSEFENILFVTSMRDKDLYNQNRRVLERGFYDAYRMETFDSKITVLKMNDFFKRPNPYKVVNDFNIQLIVRDEDQYGCGEESSFQFTFFQQLRNKMPDIKLLAVSATPYDLLDAQFNNKADVDVIEGVRPPAYFGITEMLKGHLIEDLPESFRSLQCQGNEDNKYYNIHPKVYNYIEHLLKFETGFGIIRESNSQRAIELKKLVIESYNEEFETLVIGSSKMSDFSINDGIKEVSNLVQKRRKKVVLIVVQALTAGKDLGRLKEFVRFGIEPRDKQLANGSQGIAGRFCGYHNNKSFKLLASKPLLEHYSLFEQDWEIFADETWRNTLFNSTVRGLTTQSKFSLDNREGYFTKISDIVKINYNDLITNEGRKNLDFINDEAYERLISFFKKEFYDVNAKGARFYQKGVTVRIASNYNQRSNRVFNNWNCTREDDFGNIFFKKKQYPYGILISNFPIDDERNKIGFTGIKIIKSGSTEWKNQKTSIENGSMYSNW